MRPKTDPSSSLFYSPFDFDCRSSGENKNMMKVFENRLLRRISGPDSDRNSSRRTEKSTKTEASRFSIFTLY
jgi:hypothetical protein